MLAFLAAREGLSALLPPCHRPDETGSGHSKKFCLRRLQSIMAVWLRQIEDREAKYEKAAVDGCADERRASYLLKTTSATLTGSSESSINLSLITRRRYVSTPSIVARMNISVRLISKPSSQKKPRSIWQRLSRSAVRAARSIRIWRALSKSTVNRTSGLTPWCLSTSAP